MIRHREETQKPAPRKIGAGLNFTCYVCNSMAYYVTDKAQRAAGRGELYSIYFRK